MTTEPTNQHREEAREIAGLWWHDDVEGEAELPAGSLGKLISRIASALSSRDAEIREVLEGLSLLRSDGTRCFCSDGLYNKSHENACLAARALYAKLQPAKESSNG